MCHRLRQPGKSAESGNQIEARNFDRIICIVLINLILLGVVFLAAKKRRGQYLAAIAYGAVRAVILAGMGNPLHIAIIAGLIYAGLAAGMVYFLLRVDRRDASERPAVPNYSAGGSDRMKFRWDYVPLVILLILAVM